MILPFSKLIFKFFFYFYLRVRELERDRDRHRVSAHHLLVHFLKCPWWSEVGHIEAGSLDFNLGLSNGWQEPNHLSHHHCHLLSAGIWNQELQLGIEPGTLIWNLTVLTSRVTFTADTISATTSLLSSIHCGPFPLGLQFFYTSLCQLISNPNISAPQVGKLPSVETGSLQPWLLAWHSGFILVTWGSKQLLSDSVLCVVTWSWLGIGEWGAPFLLHPG